MPPIRTAEAGQDDLPTSPVRTILHQGQRDRTTRPKRPIALSEMEALEKHRQCGLPRDAVSTTRDRRCLWSQCYVGNPLLAQRLCERRSLVRVGFQPPSREGAMRECNSALSFVTGVLGSLHVRFMAAAFTLVCCSAAHGQAGSPAALVPTQRGADCNEVAEGSAAPTRSVRVDVTLRSVADSGEQKVLSTFRRMSASPLVLDSEVTLPGGQSSHIGFAIESTMVGDEVCLRAFWTAQPFASTPPVRACGRPGEASLLLEQEIAPQLRVQIEIQTVVDLRL